MPARSRVRPLLAALCLALPAAAAEDASDADAKAVSRDPYFGEALFHAHQGDFFSALERLDAELAQHYGVDERPLDSLYPFVHDAEFSVGDFELEYRMHLRAGRAIRAVLEGDVPEPVRNDAAYRLARIYFEKGQFDTALRVLDAMHGEVPTKLVDEVAFLRANVLLALERPSDAVEVLRRIQGSDSLAGFSAYNLAIALLESGEPVAAARELDRAGRVAASDRDTKAIRDKANLVLGTLLFEAEQPERAREALERVRLTGPFSNQALLRAGWAEADLADFERAVVPWSVLIGRDATDPAVQEAKLALPYAYSRIDVHGRAAVLYQEAAETFGHELAKLDASIRSVEQGHFLAALEREEIKQDRDWVVRLRSLPDAPDTFYLISLLASHDFQTSLQNYLDLTDLRRRLERSQADLSAFDDLIAQRAAYYEPRLPEIDREFRRLDARMRLRLTQRDHLAERLERMLRAPRPELLASAEEHAALATLERLESALAAQPTTPDAEGLAARIARLRGFLLFRLESEYHARLTDVNEDLLALAADVQKLEERHRAFVRARQAATHSYVGYDARIRDLRERTGRSLEAVDALKKAQGEKLEEVAIAALAARREQLANYQNQARFAFADSYDRAAKAQVREQSEREAPSPAAAQ